MYIAALFIKNIAHALFFPVVFTILTYDLPKAHFSILYSIITTGFFLGNTGTSYLSTVLYGLSERYPWLAAGIISSVLLCLSLTYYVYKRVKPRKLQSQ